jgi:hypothetical protein
VIELPQLRDDCVNEFLRRQDLIASGVWTDRQESEHTAWRRQQEAKLNQWKADMRAQGMRRWHIEHALHRDVVAVKYPAAAIREAVLELLGVANGRQNKSGADRPRQEHFAGR